MTTLLSKLYQNLFLLRPVSGIFLIFVATLALGYFAPQVKLEVSGDSLVLENDLDLQYYREISELYESDDYLFITYTPVGDLFAPEELERIKKLRDQLRSLSGVASVTTLLDVPLLFSPAMSLTEVTQATRTLEHRDTDLELAKTELSQSPLYSKRLLSQDQKTTAIQLVYPIDERLRLLRSERKRLRNERDNNTLNPSDRHQLKLIEQAYATRMAQLSAAQENNISEVRQLLGQYESFATIHIGGVPMIVVDMLRFIRHDIVVFGGLVLGIMSLVLWMAFKSLRWVVVPFICVSASAIATVGIIGVLGWPISAVSSNFVALLLIFGLSLMIHLIVQYRELVADESLSNSDVVKQTLQKKFWPSFYTVLTTIIAFTSLVISGIRPVIDFGWIMVIALLVNLLISFTLFPALLTLASKSKPDIDNDFTSKIMVRLADFSNHSSKRVVMLFTLVSCLCFYGMSKLSVDNRFIDYFSPETEIYQGMTVIDQKLGGTTPLDIIIDAPERHSESTLDEPLSEEPLNPFDTDPFGNDPFSDSDTFANHPESTQQQSYTDSSYWYNASRLSKVKAIHDYLDNLEDTGKVLSLHTTIDTLTRLNSNQPLDDFFLSIFYKNLSSEMKAQLVSPYLSDDGNQLRITTRVYESDSGLDRQALIENIRNTLEHEFDIKPEQVHLTGMVVLYNNLLQSLFRSQILTIGAVFLAIWFTFIVIFRSIKLASLSLIPNLFCAICVLGLFGLLDVPLDLMTITVAAISVGIAVDDTIHYIHRCRSEWHKHRNYEESILSAHISIGRAMYYTSLTISIGFAVMLLSNFTPTIYFGLFTAMAMLIAMIANMTLLPVLVRKFHGFGTNQ